MRSPYGLAMMTVTVDALDRLEATRAWNRWMGTFEFPRTARDIYESFIGEGTATEQEFLHMLGANNMGGGVPSAVALELARLCREPEGLVVATERTKIDAVAHELGLYVYLLVDPRSGVPFYVGRGRGLRYASHGVEAADDNGADHSSTKVALIREIRTSGLEPEVWIARYGLTETEYVTVEAAMIDFAMSFPIAAHTGEGQRLPFGFTGQVTNSRREKAHGRGMRLLESLVEEHGAPELATKQPLLLITLGGWTDLPGGEGIAGGRTRYGAGFRPEWLASSRRVEAYAEIGDSVSAWWSLSPGSVERRGITHVVAVHRGVTRALFEIVPGSWEVKGSGRVDRRGRPIRKSAFSVKPIADGSTFDQVVGPNGHRVPGRARGAQNSIAYWPR